MATRIVEVEVDVGESHSFHIKRRKQPGRSGSSPCMILFLIYTSIIVIQSFTLLYLPDYAPKSVLLLLSRDQNCILVHGVAPHT